MGWRNATRRWKLPDENAHSRRGFAVAREFFYGVSFLNFRESRRTESCCVKSGFCSYTEVNGNMPGKNQQRQFCPLDGRYTVSYALSGHVFCNDTSDTIPSILTNCPHGDIMNIDFKNCTFTPRSKCSMEIKIKNPRILLQTVLV